jgi:hypothetical protein
MDTREQRPRVSASRVPYPMSGPKSLLGKVVTAILGAGILVAAFVFSLVVLAIVIVGGLLFATFVWWRTRDLRKQLREQQRLRVQHGSAQSDAQGQVYEGEVIREPDPDADEDTLQR